VKRREFITFLGGAAHTARMLDLTVSDKLLAIADEVIE
jgi:hypothetical protein